ncbi:MAG: hypothetical protein IT237_09205 [Bacteroidia bacterium]|nr:hypothetical protein [Bacteroidia bacterium]
MNKFAAAQEQGTSIFEKIQSTPYGYEDEEPTECPTAEAGRFWGYGNWVNTSCLLKHPDNWIDQNNDGIPDPTYSQCREREYYAFWIKIRKQDDCYLAYSCN